MISAFKTFVIQAGGTPQPLIGTWLTAALSTPVVNSSYNPTSSQTYPVNLTVADSSMFIGFNWLNVIDPVTFATERATIVSVPDATHVTVQGLVNAHPGGAYGTGAWVALGALAQSVYIQSKDGNAGTICLGTSPQMVIATGANVIKRLLTVAALAQPYDFEINQQVGSNTLTMSQFWVDGTTGDSYLPSIGVI